MGPHQSPITTTCNEAFHAKYLPHAESLLRMCEEADNWIQNLSHDYTLGIEAAELYWSCQLCPCIEKAFNDIPRWQWHCLYRRDANGNETGKAIHQEVGLDMAREIKAFYDEHGVLPYPQNTEGHPKAHVFAFWMDKFRDFMSYDVQKVLDSIGWKVERVRLPRGKVIVLFPHEYEKIEKRMAEIDSRLLTLDAEASELLAQV